jgi:hypothetical protein
MEERIKNLLDQTNLNWNVRTESIQTESGITIQDKIALVREDTNDIVGVHSDGYRPFQNQELFELLDKVSNMTGLELTKGGLFKEGRRVYVQMKSADLRLGNDLIKGYLTGINSFDGSTSLAFGPSNVTISCMNSFFAAFKQLNTKVRHTKNMVIRIDEICKGLEGVLAQEQVMFGDITRMSETRFDDVIKESVTRQLFGIKPEVDLYDNDAISTNLRNKMSRFYIDLNGELQQKGDNMWGLFSGVTKYTTHSLSKSDNTEAKMFDVYGDREKKIFSDLVELV